MKKKKRDIRLNQAFKNLENGKRLTAKRARTIYNTLSQTRYYAGNVDYISSVIPYYDDKPKFNPTKKYYLSYIYEWRETNDGECYESPTDYFVVCRWGR